MNPSIIFSIPTNEEVKLLVDDWVKKTQENGSYMRSELGNGVHDGYLLHVVFDGVDKISGSHVVYNTKVYPVKISDIKEGEEKLKNLSGHFAVIPENKSIWDFLEYKDFPSQIVIPTTNEEVSCTMREHFIGKKIYAVSVFNLADVNQHFIESGE